MSHGLGQTQRLMLFQLADHEVRVAEAAAERQRPYRSPDRWSLRTLTYGTFHAQIVAMQWTRQRVAGRVEERAREVGANAKVWAAIASTYVRMPGDLTVPDDFASHRPKDHELQRFNPSRAIAGLEKRGFVLRDRYRRLDNLALTVEGFSEARRLGGVRESEIVDLDQMQANWRRVDDFRLGISDLWVDWRDDGPPRVVGRFAHVAT
jgi:hypothetical protein